MKLLFQFRSMDMNSTCMDIERKGTLIIRRRYWRNIGLGRELEGERPLETVGSILVLLQPTIWHWFYTSLSTSAPIQALSRVEPNTTTTTKKQVQWAGASWLSWAQALTHLGWAVDLGLLQFLKFPKRILK